MGFKGRKASGGAWVDLGRFLATPASLPIPITTSGQPEDGELIGQAYIKDAAVGIPSMSLPVMVRG